jgi:hypothetical protein
MLATAAANVNAEFLPERRQPALEGTDDARRDARRMPVHAHDSPEGLKPERIRKPPQQFIPAIRMDNSLRDNGSEPGHPIGQPPRHLAAM